MLLQGTDEHAAYGKHEAAHDHGPVFQENMDKNDDFLSISTRTQDPQSRWLDRYLYGYWPVDSERL